MEKVAQLPGPHPPHAFQGVILTEEQPTPAKGPGSSVGAGGWARSRSLALSGEPVGSGGACSFVPLARGGGGV